MYENNKDKMKLTVIVPSIFMGPVIVDRPSPSIDFFKRFFSNYRLAKLSFGYVDVRDVAKAHVAAIEKEDETNGHRVILSQGSYFF